MTEILSSDPNSQGEVAAGRETWTAALDLSAAMHLGAPALCLKRAVDNRYLSTADGPGWRVIFDGTLYNAPELASELMPYEEVTSSAQLIGLAVRRWGKDFLSRIQGIFALLVLDKETGKFLAIRDRLGFQPLFYAAAGDTLLFSDSILALRNDPQLSISLNRAALADTLSRRFPDEEETYFTEIQRLTPAGKLEIDLASRRQSISKYWDPSPPDMPDDSMREENLGQFDQLLEQAVRRSLQFGKSGIFLSGGLDSVSIAAVAADLNAQGEWPAPWALSVGFPHPESNEESVQRAVANDLRLRQIFLPFAEGAGHEGLFWSNMQLNSGLGAPVHNPWRAVYLELARQAKEKEVEIIITGGGGDDWLTVNQAHMADLLGRLDFMNSIRFARSQMGSHDLPPLMMLRSLYWNNGLRLLLTRRLRLMGRSLAPKQLHELRFRKQARAKQTPPWVAADPLLRKELDQRTEQNIQRLLARSEPSGRYGFYNFSAISRTFGHFLISQSQEEDYEIGRQMGVRLHHPYWDSQLVEFLCKVPPRLLLQGGREKGLVRQSIARRFPQLGFEKQKKVRAGAFFVTIVEREGRTAWKRLGGAKTLVELGIVKRSDIDGIMSESYNSNQLSTAFRVWEVLNLESWARTFR